MRTTLLVCLVLGSVSAWAQTQEPTAPPPPPTAQPQYQPTPYPYATQPQYQPQQYQPYQQPQTYKPLRIDDWKPGEPIPQGYHSVSKPRTGLIVGGAVTFGVPYLISLLAGAIAIDTGSTNFWGLCVPVVGPFIQAGFVSSATEKVFFALDGLAQVAGVAMFIAGFAAPITYLQRDHYTWVAPVPVFTRGGGAGVGLAGGF